MKRIGTREEVFKGLAARTAGGLKKEDIIEKQFGAKILYISRKLSDKMRENFNIIRANNPNHLRNKQQKRTMVANKNNTNTINTNTINTNTINTNTINTNTINTNTINTNTEISNNQQSNQQVHRAAIIEKKQQHHAKTQKLSFKVKENTVKNIYYPELNGMDIKQLKEELLREEAEEDKGIIISTPKKEFSIEDMPDIDMNSLE
jgi:hypothetical protein